jgi:RsiW-degrading membrane proteinase PrsW (M82 family)
MENKGFHPIKKMKLLIGKIGTLNLILIIVGVFFLWFNWEMLEIFKEKDAIPETYACAVITATIGECGICGWIKTTKEKNKEKEEEED